METRQSFRPRHDLIHSLPQVAFFEEEGAGTRSERNSFLLEPDFLTKLRVSFVADTTKIFFWTSTYVGW